MAGPRGRIPVAALGRFQSPRDPTFPCLLEWVVFSFLTGGHKRTSCQCRGGEKRDEGIVVCFGRTAERGRHTGGAVSERRGTAGLGWRRPLGQRRD